MDKASKPESSFLLREAFLEQDSDDGFIYEEVSVDDGASSSGEEDLNTALQHEAQQLVPCKGDDHLVSTFATSANSQVEVVEDFVCNFLASHQMHTTLETFQAEWYRLLRTNKLKDSQAHTLPDVYAQNRVLEASVNQLKKELQEYEGGAKLSKEILVRVQKERDYHRMHHRRVLQEKEHLVAELKMLKLQYSNYGPVLHNLKHKYQVAAREKALACLERDRIKSEVECLKSTLMSVQQPKQHPSVQPLTAAATLPFANQQPNSNYTKSRYVLELPSEPQENPYHAVSKLPACTHFTRTGGFQPSHSFKAHPYAATAIDTHPTKSVLATASDDHTWKLWTLSGGERLITGEGHNDWLSAVQFNPQGTGLATSSGDGAVKVWDLVKTVCSTTLSDHQQPVWDVAWHWTGSVLASAGMDHTIKLWQPEDRSTCVSTLRGHAGCVNGVAFMPYTNTFTSCSADKSISLWDIRAGICVHTFYGHQHACYTVQPSYQGWEVFSADCFGNVLCWDVRSASCLRSWDLGPHAVNRVVVDPARSLLACASDDHVVILLDLCPSTSPPSPSSSADTQPQKVIIYQCLCLHTSANYGNLYTHLPILQAGSQYGKSHCILLHHFPSLRKNRTRVYSSIGL